MVDFKKKDFRWWLPSAPKDSLFQTWSHIQNVDSDRRVANLNYMRMYGNRNSTGSSPSSYSLSNDSDRVTLNVVKSVSDTVTSRIAKSRPQPRFLTSGGNYSLRRRAKLLEKYVDAQFYLSGVFQNAPKVFLDSCVFGTGIAKVYRVGKEIRYERTMPDEVWVDQAEGFYGDPQSIYQTKYISRDVLLDMFPDKRKEILAAPENLETQYADSLRIASRDSTADQVCVIEGWHKASGPEATDGKHQISLSTGVLVDEEWVHDYFPFVTFNWSDALRGFWGIGLAEELMGIQVEINRLLMKIQRAFQLLAVPWVLVEASSKIKKAHINNQIGAIIPYTGTPPIVRPNQTIAPEVFAHLDRLYQRAYEIAGVSQLSATSLKPSGLESGVALREFSDIETERFAVISRAYEQMFMDTAIRIVDLGKEIAKEFPGYSVVAQRDRHTIQQVKWSDVDMDKDSYVLQVFPSSSLPRTPAGRLAMIEDLMANGLIDPQEGKRLLDFPDLEASIALDRASSDNIDRIIEQMLDENVYEAPEPFMDHNLALKKTQASYNKAVNDGVPESNLQLLRQFMVATNEMIKKAQIEQLRNAAEAQGQIAPGQAPMQGAPPAAGIQGVPPNAVQASDGVVSN